jgi:hypothetical protein
MGAEIITNVGSIVKDFTQQMTATGSTIVSEHGPGTKALRTDVNEGKT